MPNKIQFRSFVNNNSRDGERDGISHATDSDGNLNVFNVERNEDGSWLNGNNGHPDNHWNGNNRWVFVRRNCRSFSLLRWGVLF